MMDSTPLPQLSAAKMRVGLQRFEDLVRCLITYYQTAARLRGDDRRMDLSRKAPIATPPVDLTARQKHFDWFVAGD